MTTVSFIIHSINATSKCFMEHHEFPDKPGLYAFALQKDSSLKKFGNGLQVIYVGKAEDSLKKRDLETHFQNEKTGQSTLRRSIGAILKTEFNAFSFSRNGTLNKPNIDNYKFNKKAEGGLSEWMKGNLVIGYWLYDSALEKIPLRTIEEKLTLLLKPTLDLDIRTRRFNLLAPELIALRQICKNEAMYNVMKNIAYY